MSGFTIRRGASIVECIKIGRKIGRQPPKKVERDINRKYGAINPKAFYYYKGRGDWIEMRCIHAPVRSSIGVLCSKCHTVLYKNPKPKGGKAQFKRMAERGVKR